MQEHGTKFQRNTLDRTVEVEENNGREKDAEKHRMVVKHWEGTYTCRSQSMQGNESRKEKTGSTNESHNWTFGS